MSLFEKSNIDFVALRKITYVIAGIFALLGIIAIIVGPKFSIDFTGGSSLELDFSAPSDDIETLTIEKVRAVLLSESISDVELQTIRGSDNQVFFLFKTKAEGTPAAKIIDLMKEHFPDYANKKGFVRLQEEVGPRVGDELKGKAVMAAIYSLIVIIIYIWWRFEFTFGVTAVLALFLDVLTIVGLFFITGKEISLTIVAALLTVIGYSINDTIVIFDRVRENIRIYRRENYNVIINRSINETLSRTAITSLTTFVVVLSLRIFGGSVIRDFAFALMIGVVGGTFSSIFIAGPLAMDFAGQKKEKKGYPTKTVAAKRTVAAKKTTSKAVKNKKK